MLESHRFTYAGVGGAISIGTPIDSPLNLLYCESGTSLQFRDWEPYSFISITNTTVVNNSAVCTGTCSGGGIALTSGGELVITNSTIANNSALSFGGGLLLGGTSSGLASCSLTVHRSRIGGNTAPQTGAQVYNNCGGNVTITDTWIDMSASAVEVSFLEH